MKIGVIANGTWDVAWGTHVLKEVDFLICADGGANSAAKSGCMPDLLVGDLDSISPENLTLCENSKCIIERFPCNKDETDLELALGRAEAKASLSGEQDIWLYGATGKRIDHFLGNLALMEAYANKGLRIHLVDAEHHLWIIQGAECIRGYKGQGISLIALTERAVVSTEGLYYPLQNEAIFRISPRGISNVFLGDEAVVKVHEGWVLVVLTEILENRKTINER